MIHVILLILKWIGWILLTILGFLLLLLCIALFAPLRYEAEGMCKNDIKTLRGTVKLSFLLHLISGTFRYEEGQLRWMFRVAWKQWKSEAEEPNARSELENEEISELKPEPEVEEATELKSKLKTEEAPEEKPERKLEEKPTEQKKPEGKTKEPKRTKPTKTKPKKKSFSERLEALFTKLKDQYEKICVKIKSLLRKKNLVMKFLESKIHQAAFRKIVGTLKKMLLRLKPKKIDGTVEFGFEDPYWTGKVLAWASVFYPWYADSLEVLPNFEEQVLDGSLEIKGKLALHTFVFAAVKIILDKNVRLTIGHIKKLKTML